MKYLVTGASGQLGTLVIDALLKTENPAEIAALIRRPGAAGPLEAKGVTTRIAAYTEPDALRKALAGVERLLLISSSEVGERATQHTNVIEAAKAAGVPFIAYTSILNAKASPLTILPGEHVATENALAASGLHYAVLRNGWYTENYAMGAGSALQLGALYGAAGDGRISSAARKDYAEAAAALLKGDLPASGTVYELAGDDSYTLGEFAAQISDIAGKEIPYVNLPEAEYATALEQAGLPVPVARMLADSDAGAAKGGLHSSDNTLSRLIGHPTTPWQDTLRTAIA
ncbi:SDR family oxidoreductase [Sagittula sp. S175]|uniref:SDR family oxidoreductase n=1 Tax=Sagittula sp. S175 TaxID=3415129 RepID=UPI003C7A9026